MAHTNPPHPPRTKNATSKAYLVVLGTAGALGSADLESVCEATVDNLQVLRSAGAGGLAPLGLLAPVDCFMKNNVPSKRTRSDFNKSNFFS